MIAEAIRRSPLAEYAERFAALYAATDGALSIREVPFLTQINLRADPTDQPVMKRIADLIGIDLPLTPNTVASTGHRRALWLGPDEWLIVDPPDQVKAIEQSLRDALADASASIVDVSANRSVLQIQGRWARELLAQGITIDLHPRVFAPGRCAQTLVAKSQVIIERRGPEDLFYLFVRCSHSTYLADWILDAADGLALRSGG